MNVISDIQDIWKAKSLSDDFDKELEFCENRINLNHAIDFDPFLDDLIMYDTLNIIKESIKEVSEV